MWGQEEGVGQMPAEPQLLPLPALSPPRSFSSMSDITGEALGTHGEDSPRGTCLAPLRHLPPTLLLACVPLPEVLPSPVQAEGSAQGTSGYGGCCTLSSAPVLARLCGVPPQFWSTLAPLLENRTVILAGPCQP